MSDKKRVMLVASLAASLENFRGDYIKDLIKAGYEVFAAAPDMNEDEETFNFLKEINAHPLVFQLQRSGLNPFKDLQTIRSLKKIIKENKIDLVLPYTIKPVIYSSLAANSLNIPVISLITGLGYTFSGMSIKARVLQKFSQFLYRTALRKNKVVVLQNKDDYDLFVEKKILAKTQKFDIVSGSGINLSQFSFRKKVNNGDKIVFVFVARLIREKGIHLYIEAAKVLKPKYPQAEFHIIGWSPKGSPSAIDESILETENKKGTIVHHGQQNNVQDFLHKSDVFVLPTFYREGIPRSSLEATSKGMPLIITDAPGCRETIKDNQNGILIEPKNLDSLVNALEFFITNPDKIEIMGLNSRKYAEERFDVKIINKQLIGLIGSVLNKK